MKKTIYQCDVCKEEVSQFRHWFKMKKAKLDWLETVTWARPNYERVSTDKQYDLCMDCWLKIKDLLKKLNKEE